MRVGVLTGGGDCPGLNAAIRAIVRKGIDHYGHAIVGFRDGWRGPLENLHEELTVESTRGILPRGGTILGTSRTNPFKGENGPERVRETMETLHLDGLIAIGGEDTLGAAARLYEDNALPVIGVPKTIDNDLAATDVTFGFDTALQVATEAIDRLHTTAESHHRVMVVEVMGRHAGWIALHSGLAGGADVILIPERPFDIEDVCGLIRRRHSRGRTFSIVVVAEGALPAEGTMEVTGGEEDEFGHVRLGGIGHAPRARDRAENRFRDARRRPGPHPAGRHPDRVRPRARHQARSRRDRRGARGALGDHAGAARHADQARPAERGGRTACARFLPRTTRSPRRSSDDGSGRELAGTACPRSRATRIAAATTMLAALALIVAGCATPGSGIQAGEHVTVYVSMPLRGPEAVEGRDVVGGAKLALADAGGKVGELAVRAVYLDDTAGRGARARLDPGGGRRERQAGVGGLDGDRLPWRLRLGRQPVLAADHERSADAPGLPGQRRGRPGAAVPRRRRRAPQGRPADRRAHLRPGHPQRPRAG